VRGTTLRCIDDRVIPPPPEPESATDFASLAARFTALLRASGVSATATQSARFVRAVAAFATPTLTDVYWAARITLVVNQTDIATFNQIFAQVFRGLPDPNALGESRGDPNAPPPVTMRGTSKVPPPRNGVPAAGATSGGPDASSTENNDDADRRLVAVPTVASSIDRLAQIDFGDLEPHEMAALAVLMRRLRLTPPLRRGRRNRRHPHGDRLDLRATLRRGARTGGDPVTRVYQRKKPRARRLIVLCDISGSMESYARAYVQFLHASTATSRAEVFTFATRLTRLTKALAGTQPQLALTRAAMAAPDWRGGTRIGVAVKAFLDGYGRRGLARGAVVVVLSDGWERDDPAVLGEQMARLHRLAHRVIWVNPRSADPSFAPLAGGMSAALPYCDEFLSGHSLAAMGDVVDAISRSGRVNA
jgi:uncharacterized protein with von Willebrand factor type A (vWA) domain